MKLSYSFFPAMLIAILASSCATDVRQMPVQNRPLAFGNYTETHPLWEGFKVGTIAVFSGNANAVVLDTGSWLSKVGAKEAIDMKAVMDAACDKVTKLCTIASITETKRGFEATFNAKLGSFESNGKAIRATSSIAKLTNKVIFRTDKGTDGIVEWNKFQSNAAFGGFVNELRQGKGNLAGTSVVVSRIDLAHGSLEYTLNAELDANAQVLLLKRLDLSGTKFNVTFNKDKMTLTSTPAAPFVLGWRLDEIKL